MKLMRSLLLLTAVLAFIPRLAAQESAYEAVRALKADRGADILSHIIEVRGAHGQSQPTLWKIVVQEPMARGGVREYELRNGMIVSERTPVASFAGRVATLDFSKLNLDSTGAFTAAEKQAAANRATFDSVDYRLAIAMEDTGGFPCWELKLIDADKRLVGTLRISALSGKVIASSGLIPTSNGPRTTTVTTTVDRGETTQGQSGLEKFGDKVRRHFLRDGGAMQEFFTGRRTVDREVQEYDRRKDEEEAARDARERQDAADQSDRDFIAPPR